MPGFSPILGAVAGMVVWALHFTAVYAANAIVCARQLADLEILGLPIVPVLVMGATALALAAVAVIGWQAVRRLRSGLSGEEGEDDPPQFVIWFSAAITLLAALAIIWEAVPSLILRPCVV